MFCSGPGQGCAWSDVELSPVAVVASTTIATSPSRDPFGIAVVPFDHCWAKADPDVSIGLEVASVACETDD